jgi:hypothetical protein
VIKFWLIKKINWAEFVDNIINDDNKILPTSLTSVIILNTKMQKRQVGNLGPGREQAQTCDWD